MLQRVAGIQIRIVYNRPSARGRKLFRGLVPYGRAWNPGADQATRIELSRDLLVAGRLLPAGRYSLWVIPEKTRWTVIFSDAWDVFHFPYPEGHDALRLPVAPGAVPHTETLSFDFPLVEGHRAILALRWGRTGVPIPLEAP